MIYCLVIPTFLNLVKPEIFFFENARKFTLKKKKKSEFKQIFKHICLKINFHTWLLICTIFAGI